MDQWLDSCRNVLPLLPHLRLCYLNQTSDQWRNYYYFITVPEWYPADIIPKNKQGTTRRKRGEVPYGYVGNDTWKNAGSRQAEETR